MQPDFSSWLEREPRAPKPKKRIPPMGKKRQREARIYSQKRRAFLKAHPKCQAISKIWDYFVQTQNEKAWVSAPDEWPASTEIHHMKKPRSKYLNDESTWLAVSKWSHRWIEDHKSIARQLGLLK